MDDEKIREGHATKEKEEREGRKSILTIPKSNSLRPCFALFPRKIGLEEVKFALEIGLAARLRKKDRTMKRSEGRRRLEGVTKVVTKMRGFGPK